MTAAVFAWRLSWFTVDAVAAHGVEVLIGFGLYVLLGIGWMIAKWWFFVHAKARAHRSKMAMDPDYARYVTIKAPRPGEHKQDIVRWMAWWPFSMVGTILNDPFRRLFEAIYRNLAVFLQQISDRVFADILEK